MKTYDFTKQPSVLIQGAMEPETVYMIAKLRDVNDITIGNWKFTAGFLGENQKPVIISRTYQGMVNAAAATSLALTSFAPCAVINQGLCGGHDRAFHRGDIVLGEKAVMMSAVEYAYAPEGAGMSEADSVPLPIEIFRRDTGETGKVTEFPCDEKLLAAAEETARRMSACGHSAGYSAGHSAGQRRIARGVIGSADEWNNQLDRIALLRERCHTASEDMETAAAAQLCMSYGIPFLGIRILSNSIVNGEEYDESVAEVCQQFVLDVVENI